MPRGHTSRSDLPVGNESVCFSRRQPASSMPGTVPTALPKLMQFVLTTIPGDRHHYYPHLTDREPEAPGG